MKFKRVERSNRALVDKHLREVALFDASVFDDDDEDETDEESENKKGTTNSSRKRSAAAKAGAEKVKRRRRGRRQISNRRVSSLDQITTTVKSVCEWRRTQMTKL